MKLFGAAVRLTLLQFQHRGLHFLTGFYFIIFICYLTYVRQYNSVLNNCIFFLSSFETSTPIFTSCPKLLNASKMLSILNRGI